MPVQRHAPSTVALLLRAAALGAALLSPVPARAEETPDQSEGRIEDARLHTKQADLRAVLQRLEPPRSGRAVVRTLKARLWQTDAEPWKEIPVDDLRSGAFTPSDDHSYALAAVVHCTETYVGGRWEGEKTAWYLLPQNRVAAFDHFGFQDQCTFFNEYEPAVAQLVPAENALLARMAREFPPPHLNRAELYVKGLALIRAGRLADAETRLAQADGAVDVGFGSTEPEPRADLGRGTRVTTAEEAAALRAQLVAALEGARSGAVPADGRVPAEPSNAEASLVAPAPVALARALPPREAILDLPMIEFAASAERSPLLSVAAFGVNGKARFSAIRGAEGSSGRRALSEVPTAQVPATLEELVRDGFRVVELCGYLVDAREAMAIVAEKNDPPVVTEVRPALTAADLATTDAELSAKGFRMQRLCGYSIGGDARFAAIWARVPGPEMRWRVDLTPQKLQKEIGASPVAEWTLRDFGGYVVGGDDRYVVLFEKGPGPAWEALGMLDGAAVARKIAIGRGKGLSPAVLRVSVFSADEIRYTLLLRSPSEGDPR